MRFSLSSSSPMRTGIVFFFVLTFAGIRAGGNGYGNALTLFVKLINETQADSPASIALFGTEADLGVCPDRSIDRETAPDRADGGRTSRCVPMQPPSEPG